MPKLYHGQIIDDTVEGGWMDVFRKQIRARIFQIRRKQKFKAKIYVYFLN